MCRNILTKLQILLWECCIRSHRCRIIEFNDNSWKSCRGNFFSYAATSDRVYLFLHHPVDSKIGILCTSKIKNVRQCKEKFYYVLSQQRCRNHAFSANLRWHLRSSIVKCGPLEDGDVLRKPTAFSGRSQRCSSAYMWCVSLCCCRALSCPQQ